MGPDQSPGEARTRASSFRWVVAALIFLIYAIAAADRANLGVALPFIRKEFAMSNTEAGALISLFLVAYAIAQLPAGLALSRFGVRNIFSIAMITTSVATGLVGTAGSIFALKIYRFALGLAEGPLPIGIAAIINQWFPAREKGTATGIFLSAVKFGPVLVPPVCAVILSLWGWREIFFVFAVPGLVLSLVWYALVTNHPSESRFVNAAERAHISSEADAAIVEASQARPMPWLDRLIRVRAEEPLTSRASIFRSWNVYGCALGYCFQIGISNVLLAWIPTYLISEKHFSIANMGFVAAAPWVGAVVGNVLGGVLSDRLLEKRRKPGMMISALATVGTMFALIHSPAQPIPYAALLFLTGVLLSIGFSAYMAYPMALATKSVFPVASALVNTGGQLGGAAAPFLTGILLDVYGWDAVFTLMAGCSLVSFLILLTISEPLKVRAASEARTSMVT